MQFCSVTVRLGASLLHTVTNKIVSVPEIQVLKHIHGHDAVVDIVPYGRGAIDPESRQFVADALYSHEEERERLRVTYELNNNNEEALGLVGKLFGLMGPLPERLRDINIDPRAEAKRVRAEADSLAQKMELLGDEIDEKEQAEDDDFDKLAAGSRRKRAPKVEMADAEVLG